MVNRCTWTQSIIGRGEVVLGFDDLVEAGQGERKEDDWEDQAESSPYYHPE